MAKSRQGPTSSRYTRSRKGDALSRVGASLQAWNSAKRVESTCGGNSSVSQCGLARQSHESWGAGRQDPAAFLPALRYLEFSTEVTCLGLTSCPLSTTDPRFHGGIQVPQQHMVPWGTQVLGPTGILGHPEQEHADPADCAAVTQVHADTWIAHVGAQVGASTCVRPMPTSGTER